MNSIGYSSIPSGDTNGYGPDTNTVKHPTQRKFVFLGVIALVLLVICLGGVSTSFFGTSSDHNAATSTDTLASALTSIPMPTGVNLGSWLSLEDYFYVGPTGAVEVATPDDKVAGSCLPPLHTGPSTGPKWHAETDLYANLTTMKGGSVRDTIKIFHAFRTSYLDWEEELAQIAALGIKHVRVPISWCLTDYDPSNDDILGRDVGDDTLSEDAELERRFTCLDPFFAKDGVDVRWPAVPRPFLASFLRDCSHHNLKATLDMHTYPGGTSIGTFSGVWPRRPLFWKYDDPENKDDVGRSLLRDFFTWIESLRENDPAAFEGVGGITPMNEPAHLAGIFGPGSSNPTVESFLPSLPDGLANAYLEELGSSGANTFSDESKLVVPDGPHLRMLLWQRDAIAMYRATALSQSGIGLYVNVHESVFTPSVLPTDMDDDGKLAVATAIFGAWWAKTTTPAERSTSLAIDSHRYHAWGPSCQGTVDGPPSGNYTCGDEEATAETLGRCAEWAGMYRKVMDEQVGQGARLVSAEFSASTHHSVLHSCTDATTLRKTYLAQVEAADASSVELYWWSWKMPHGGAFRPAWSFKHFLHRIGVDGFGPDESEIVCGGVP